MGQSDNIWGHFNELALVLLLIALISLDVHMVHHSMDSESITWLQGIVGQVLAALLTLMVKLPKPDNNGGTKQ